MKFQQLTVGQRFEFEGLIYVKISPLLARAEASANQRLLPRSATVRLVEQDVASTTCAIKESANKSDDIAAAAEKFRSECVASVEALADIVPADRLTVTLRAIENAYTSFHRKL